VRSCSRLGIGAFRVSSWSATCPAAGPTCKPPLTWVARHPSGSGTRSATRPSEVAESGQAPSASVNPNQVQRAGFTAYFGPGVGGGGAPFDGSPPILVVPSKKTPFSIDIAGASMVPFTRAGGWSSTT